MEREEIMREIDDIVYNLSWAKLNLYKKQGGAQYKFAADIINVMVYDRLLPILQALYEKEKAQ